MSKPRIQMLRYSEGGVDGELGEQIDDIFIKRVRSVHIEQMDDSTYWVGIYGKDGKRRLTFVFASKSRRAEVEFVQTED